VSLLTLFQNLLRDPNIHLAAAPTGVARASASLSVQHNLVAASVGVGKAQATLRGTLAVTGVGLVAGGLTVQHNLASAPIGVGKATASLSVQHNLSGGIIGVGLSSGVLQEKHFLAGAIVGVGSLSGTLPATVVAAPATGRQGGVIYIQVGDRKIAVPESRGEYKPSPLNLDWREVRYRETLAALLAAGIISEEEFAMLEAAE
jgi:hypothetical protein